VSAAFLHDWFRPWTARARAWADAMADALRAYWTTLVTFDPSQVTSPGSRRRRTVATAQCLTPFLKALGYRGTEQNILEATPHFQTGMDIADLRTALVNLGYRTEARVTRPRDIDPRLMPCLHEADEPGKVVVLLGAAPGVIFAVVDGHQRPLREDEAGSVGTAYFAVPLEAREVAGDRRAWSARLLRRFKPFAAQLLLISALSNMLSIAVPLFVMIVYDRVIALQALDVLPMLLVGIAVAIGADLYLRTLRSRLLGTLAARIDYLIGTATFAKLLRLPLSYTDGPPIAAQIARLREFQAVRDLFAGPAAGAIVDFPFTIIALTAVALIAGWLVLVPLTACAVFATIGYLGARWLQTYEQAQSASATQLFNHVTETTLHHESIKREGAEVVWAHRFRLMSADAATRASELQDRAAAVEALSQFLNSAAAMAVLAFGALMVIDGGLSVGALIATMALTWRILSPAQQLFQTLARVGRLRASIQSMNQMLRLTDEYDASIPNLARAPRHGRIALSRVGLRYGKDADPALMNVSLNVPAGKMIALTGPNGSGKSSILSVIQGLYQPQSGIVRVDGVDIRQLPPKLLRRSIACAPQKIDLFYGTIAQNLRLADPLAAEEALRAAADDAGILKAIELLPDGFNARLGDAATQSLPPGFLRQLTIARALVRKAPILLLDEPEAMLDGNGADAIQQLLQRLRGMRTVLLVTHRPSYIRLADFAVFMRGGAIEFGGKPDGAIAKLLGQTNNGIAA
jgi:ATP-binding cassette subfamily C protein/ATP-binding cassette subfamily C protein LapB